MIGEIKMTQIIYVSDSIKQSIDFINNLVFDLRELGVENIKHDREHNLVAIGDMEARGICIYKSCICCGMRDIKYFIDGIDMRNYDNASKRQLDGLTYHIKETMSHFRKGTKQLDGKEELIKILVEG